MADWTTFIVPAVGFACAVTALYVRASQAEHDKRIAVIQSELSAARQEIKDNYKYCHDANHDTRDIVSDLDARFRLTEFKLGLTKF